VGGACLDASQGVYEVDTTCTFGSSLRRGNEARNTKDNQGSIRLLHLMQHVEMEHSPAS